MPDEESKTTDDSAHDGAASGPKRQRRTTPEGESHEETGEKGRAAHRDDATTSEKDEANEGEGEGDEGSSEAGEGEGDDEGGAAQRVADALGVGEDAEEGEEVGETEAAAALNRAARRREEALGRRRKRKSAAAATGAEADPDLPKDKNKRAKELLARRREQASAAASSPRSIDLLPGEMVDDALSRSASAVGKWVRNNFTAIQWVVLAGLVGGAGFLFYSYHSDKSAAVTAESLFTAVADARGSVVADDKRSDEEKEATVAKVFKTADERSTTALAAFRQVENDSPKSGAAILAKLGEAGVLLDKRDYPGALAAYSAVAASSLAAADPDVKGRAIEGQGLAKEGAGDKPGALAAFKEMQGIDVKGYKELALYHQGRILLAQGDSDGAKKLFKEVHDKLQPATPAADVHPFQYLETSADEYLRRIDPNAIPAKTPVGGRGSPQMSQEEIEKIIKRARDQAAQKKDPH